MSAPPQKPEYVRVCPVCGTASPSDAAQCIHCGSLLFGVDLTLPQDSPAPSAPEPAAEPTPELRCPHEDCGAVNPPGNASCLYCGRPLNIEQTAVPPAPTIYRLPSALADKFRIVEVMPAGGGEAEIMVLAGAETGARVVAKLYRPGILPKPEVLERVSQVAFRHVVHLIAWGESDGIGYEVMEYCPEGSLRKLMANGPGPLPRDLMRDCVAEIAAALAALHELNVIHRDLKPENVLVRRLQPLDLALTDFGIASVSDATQVFTTAARTVKYGAPETLSGVLDAAADWWSLGMIVAELVGGRHPFAGLSDAVVTHRLITGAADLDAVTDPDWRKLCRGLLLRDPGKRWGAAEIRRWLDGDPTLDMPEEDAPVALVSAARPYRIEDSISTTPAELAVALATHWEAARKDLMRGQLSAWFGQELRDDNLLRFVQDLIELRDATDDMRLFRLIRHLAPTLPPLWRGTGLALADLVAQAANAEQGNVAAADWLVSIYGQKVLRELPAGQFPAEAALVARWEAARARFETLWRETEALRTRWRKDVGSHDGIPDFDALVFGQPEATQLPPPAKLHPRLLLALADEPYAAALLARLRAEAAPHLPHAPWLARLLESDDPAAWIAAGLLLPHAQSASDEVRRQRERVDAETVAQRAALLARTNQALAMLRDSCELGLFASEFRRGNALAATQALLELLEEAQAEGLAPETPVMRTLRRAEPIALRIQEQLDAWEHAAQINSVLRNPRLAQGAVYGVVAFIVLVQTVPRAFLLTAFALIVAIVGWRVMGVVNIRAEIRKLAKLLPARVPSSMATS